MNRRFIPCIVLVLVVTATATRAQEPAATPRPAITPQQVDALVQPCIEGEIVNAVSVAIVIGDQAWTRHYGNLSSDVDRKPDDSTIYEIGSMSKVFTGILLAHAVENGDARLDQPIGSILEQLQAANEEVGNSIQLWHLATHWSGLPRMPNNMNPANPANPYADYDREQMIAFISAVEPKRKPEEAVEYSNFGAALMGELLAMSQQSSYENLLDESIVRPLEMSDTTLKLTSEQKQRLAPPHNADLKPDTSWDFDAFAGAGGIRSTSEDMIRFIKANLNPPEGPLGEAIELAWKQHLPAKANAFAMGLGWHIARDGSTRWHNGQTGGYHSMMLISRQLNAGVVVLCNTASGVVDPMAESIIQTIGGMDVKPPDFKQTKQHDVAVETVARLEGRYQIVPAFILTVRAEKEKLFVQATAQPELRVYPVSDTKWKYRAVEAELSFELPEEGNATSVTLHQGGRDMRAPRVDE